MGIQELAISTLSKPATMAIFLIVVLSTTPMTEGAIAEWCVADPQAPSNLLQGALDWACRENGTDCTTIQWNHTCYLPNTLLSHASYAFNSYRQNIKHNGGSCFFNSAAFVIETDPSYDACHFVYVP
ncbi:hypothetical protein SUGI_0203730 [Cryptomeria japonica]|uniref:glucan endo-1,3-beta-glucosidase 13 n=1 Tax=Cryptomeria japonica TaxID=3369 RepID=UPI002408E8E4|nr:glucan endo-1,3-beta-glucosidase 13 [Cryptomeria japonica]GLJ13033.1 hypothetical protein SUGI_0203730 [Cryptomeria japonica]